MIKESYYYYYYYRTLLKLFILPIRKKTSESTVAIELMQNDVRV